jgi:hydrogenase maturation protein HypF
MIRLAVRVQGVVQGVGFRPFVHRAARARGLTGWVQNRSDGLALEVEGPEPVVHDFLELLRNDAPTAARVERVEAVVVAATGEVGFRIVTSAAGASTGPVLPADRTTCVECAEEVASPDARRHRYPFTNCTRCGPRWTIIEALPYDRERTTMRRFVRCAACDAEYGDPVDRRFHAEPIACPACGPRLRALSPSGEQRGHGEPALAAAVATLVGGGVLALKGLGGFQLLVDAADAAAVARLRRGKGREEKPFALMCPTLDVARGLCTLSREEEAALVGERAPILLLRRRHEPRSRVADAVAPRSPRLGIMLPYTPLHRLLLDAVARPLVCTSGNLSEEPMCIDDEDALARLGRVADLFLVHDRPIARPVDDSVARVGPSGLEVLRRARGFAPEPLRLATPGPCVLALGGHLKSTVTLSLGDQAVVSQHLGDLDSPEAHALLERTVADLVRVLDARPAVVACDLHPDYASTRLAERLAAGWDAAIVRVQHHHAHLAACMAEHGLVGRALGLAWDGAGLGPDGTLWGGEALVVDGATFRRVAHLRAFRLPGGARAMREPRRVALGLLHAMLGDDAGRELAGLFRPAELRVLLGMLRGGVRAPWTTSVGRLFDAVAALIDVRTEAGFEGQAAMELESAADEAGDDEAYPLPLGGGVPAVADWEPLVHAIRRDRARGVPATHVAARFHAALAELATEIARRAGLPRVVLSGGCFQNVRLARLVRTRLAACGFEVWTPCRYPPNDGGLSLGQALVAAWSRKEADDVSRHPG